VVAAQGGQWSRHRPRPTLFLSSAAASRPFRSVLKLQVVAMVVSFVGHAEEEDRRHGGGGGGGWGV